MVGINKGLSSQDIELQRNLDNLQLTVDAEIEAENAQFEIKSTAIQDKIETLNNTNSERKLLTKTSTEWQETLKASRVIQYQASVSTTSADAADELIRITEPQKAYAGPIKVQILKCAEHAHTILTNAAGIVFTKDYQFPSHETLTFNNIDENGGLVRDSIIINANETLKQLVDKINNNSNLGLTAELEPVQTQDPFDHNKTVDSYMIKITRNIPGKLTHYTAGAYHAVNIVNNVAAPSVFALTNANNSNGSNAAIFLNGNLIENTNNIFTHEASGITIEAIGENSPSSDPAMVAFYKEKLRDPTAAPLNASQPQYHQAGMAPVLFANAISAMVKDLDVQNIKIQTFVDRVADNAENLMNKINDFLAQATEQPTSVMKTHLNTIKNLMSNAAVRPLLKKSGITIVNNTEGENVYPEFKIDTPALKSALQTDPNIAKLFYDHENITVKTITTAGIVKLDNNWKKSLNATRLKEPNILGSYQDPVTKIFKPKSMTLQVNPAAAGGMPTIVMLLNDYSVNPIQFNSITINGDVKIENGEYVVEFGGSLQGMKFTLNKFSVDRLALGHTAEYNIEYSKGIFDSIVSNLESISQLEQSKIAQDELMIQRKQKELARAEEAHQRALEKIEMQLEQARNEMTSMSELYAIESEAAAALYSNR